MTPPAEQSGHIRVFVGVVKESASHAACTRAHVLVATPTGKVHLPIVQFQWHIAHSVRQVPTNDATLKTLRLHHFYNILTATAPCNRAKLPVEVAFFECSSNLQIFKSVLF